MAGAADYMITRLQLLSIDTGIALQKSVRPNIARPKTSCTPRPGPAGPIRGRGPGRNIKIPDI